MKQVILILRLNMQESEAKDDSLYLRQDNATGLVGVTMSLSLSNTNRFFVVLLVFKFICESN